MPPVDTSHIERASLFPYAENNTLFNAQHSHTARDVHIHGMSENDNENAWGMQADDGTNNGFNKYDKNPWQTNIKKKKTKQKIKQTLQ